MQNERGSPMSLMLMSISFALYCGLWLAFKWENETGSREVRCLCTHMPAETLPSYSLAVQEAKTSMQVWPKLSEVERTQGLAGGRSFYCPLCLCCSFHFWCRSYLLAHSSLSASCKYLATRLSRCGLPVTSSPSVCAFCSASRSTRS